MEPDEPYDDMTPQDIQWHEILTLNDFQESGGPLHHECNCTDAPRGCIAACLNCLRLIAGAMWIYVTSALLQALYKEHRWSFTVILAAKLPIDV
ncbi:hypothetical protein HPB52_017551 [Rhipicephalus sanguineus]|uniref:Uncharacterized protein n=1 Tax=Rhipicephalus sanguineus TaxID=34632 RepID=A0A9D4TB25_RHISA|nr:hypothetical protein HPB52_017551 [Rhipicephalus sanguineus]